MINHLQEARQAKGYDNPSFLRKLKADKVLFLIIQCTAHCPLGYIWQPNSGCMWHGSSGFGMISASYPSTCPSSPTVLLFSTILGSLGNQIQGSLKLQKNKRRRWWCTRLAASLLMFTAENQMEGQTLLDCWQSKQNCALIHMLCGVQPGALWCHAFHSVSLSFTKDALVTFRGDVISETSF